MLFGRYQGKECGQARKSLQHKAQRVAGIIFPRAVMPLKVPAFMLAVNRFCWKSLDNKKARIALFSRLSGLF
jgi:hypothetical protein